MDREIKKTELNKAVSARKDKTDAVVSARPHGKTEVYGDRGDYWALGVLWDKAGDTSSPTLCVSQLTPAQMTALTRLGAKVTDKAAKGIEISVAKDKVEQAKAILRKK